jgi:hypothetical protein
MTEIERQCHLGIEAYDRIWAEVEKLRPLDSTLHDVRTKLESDDPGVSGEDFNRAFDRLRRQNDRVFATVQAFLSHAALVSKLLWSSPTDHDQARRARRDSLRRELGIHKTYSIAATKWRNHFEHIDERIDVLASRQQTILMDQIILPGPTIEDLDPTQYFRALDIDSRTFYF